jgi:hypothetical protein
MRDPASSRDGHQTGQSEASRARFCTTLTFVEDSGDRLFDATADIHGNRVFP